jgi:hypothetical protein
MLATSTSPSVTALHVLTPSQELRIRKKAAEKALTFFILMKKLVSQ